MAHLSLSQHSLSPGPSAFRSGQILVVVSALVFSTAGIFTKAVSADAWDVVFWRGVSAFGFTLGYLIFTRRLWFEIRAFSRPAALVCLLMALGTAAFIPAFKLTSVAHVALIYATAPFVAAALAWLVLRERPGLRVSLASLFSILGVGIIISGTSGPTSLLGDGLAMIMTLCMAGTMVIYRARPSTTAALPAAISSLLLLPVSGLLGAPLSAPVREIPVLIAFGLVFAIASVTLSEGARRLPASDTALLSSLEMPLAPLLAWLILAEAVTGRIWLGGGIVFLAVLWSQGMRLR